MSNTIAECLRTDCNVQGELQKKESYEIFPKGSPSVPEILKYKALCF
jgi:hypothetical protein